MNFCRVRIDILRLLDHWLGIIPDFIKQFTAKIGMMVIVLLAGASFWMYIWLFTVKTNLAGNVCC